MIEIARRWRTPATSVAAATVGVFVFAGATASAEPVLPLPPQPAPSAVSQTAPLTPTAALTPAAPNAALAVPQLVGQPGAAAAAAAAAPGGIATPQVGAPAPVPITPAATGTLTDFFKEKGVILEPQVSHDFKALTIVLPMPRGWVQVPDPNVPDAFAVIADRVGGNGLYSSNAQVVVYKLVGEFDPREAISHGFVDSQQLPGVAIHRRIAGRNRWHAVVDHRRHLSRERHDAEHLATQHHRNQRSGQIPRVARRHYQRRPGGRGGRLHRRDRPGLQGQLPDGCGARSAGPASASGPARCARPAGRAAADPPTARTARDKGLSPRAKPGARGDAQHGTARGGLVSCGPCSSPPCSACAPRS